MNILKIYKNKFIQLKKDCGLKNIMQVPKLKKIVVNIGLKHTDQDSKILKSIERDIASICSQKPIIIKAKKSIAGFKIRDDFKIGMKVTLRRKKMYSFFGKLVSIVIPRIRDFRGLKPNSFDGKGNYCFGIKEQIIFPEIDYDKIDKIRGMDICLVTTANNNKHSKMLLKTLGFPFKEE